MSTMYYTIPDEKPIGQIHNKGKDLGYHFTWCMFPLEYARFRKESALVRDERGGIYSMRAFEDEVDGSASQSFDERIE